ncbi:MAG: hypothetical protein AAGC88_00865 [Bacteroidota bacterium]
MKRITSTLVMLSLFVVTTAHAQSKVKEKDVYGAWVLKIEIKEETWEQELEDQDNAIARAVIQGVSGLVDGILEEIDIRFEFMDDNEVRVSTEAFGDDDVEYTDWYINSQGELEIGDTDHWDDNDDTVWLMEDGLLIAYDRDGRTKVDDDARVYMVKID